MSEEVLVLDLEGVLDLHSVPRLRAVIAERPSEAALVLDLSRLTFIDTTGVQALLQTHTASRQPPEWAFALIAGTNVHRVLEISGLNRVLRWVDHPDEVLDRQAGCGRRSGPR